MDAKGGAIASFPITRLVWDRAPGGPAANGWAQAAEEALLRYVPQLENKLGLFNPPVSSLDVLLPGNEVGRGNELSVGLGS
jgi:hypothetical protein